MQKSESFLFDLYAFTQSLRALILTNALLCDTKPNFNLILSDDSSYFYLNVILNGGSANR